MTGHPLLQLERMRHRIQAEQSIFKLTCPILDRCTYCAGIGIFHFDQWVHTCEKPACMARAQEHIRGEYQRKREAADRMQRWRELQREREGQQ